MANERILLMDDDPDMRKVLGLYLEKNGYKTFTSNNGYQAIQMVEEVQPDLIILDVLMPNLDGFELCQYIRKKTDVPILFFSSRVDDLDTIMGLGIGGDDYIPKTTSLPVVVAKIKAHLRRNRTLPSLRKNVHDPQAEEKSVLAFPGLVIKLDSAVVEVDGSPIKLSAKEYQLLCLLAKSPDRIFSVESLFEQIWGEESLGDHRTVLVHISNLRKKLEQNLDGTVYIQTFRGIGYKFNNFQN